MAEKILTVGEKFGKWTVTGVGKMHVSSGGKRQSTSDAVCDCGAVKSIKNTNLKMGYAKSCGCDKNNGTPVGTRFFRLTVVGVGEPCVGRQGKRDATSVVLCECGETRTIRNYSLASGNTKSCGRGTTCVMPVGKRVGRLTVTGIGEPRISAKGERSTTSVVLCDCGQVKTIRNSSLKAGATTSCGCATVNRLTTHGKTGTTEYRTWSAMKGRVGKGYKQHRDYADRGITVCDRWRNSFESFLEDMGPRPPLCRSIDRSENNGHYSCGKCPQCVVNGWAANCRWVTQIVQENNKRNNVRIAFYGKSLTVAEWSRISQVSPDAIYRRLRAGWDAKSAVWTPAPNRSPRSPKKESSQESH